MTVVSQKLAAQQNAIEQQMKTSLIIAGGIFNLVFAIFHPEGSSE